MTNKERLVLEAVVKSNGDCVLHHEDCVDCPFSIEQCIDTHEKAFFTVMESHAMRVKIALQMLVDDLLGRNG